MTETNTPDVPQSSASRPVLLWLVDGDQSRIEANVQQAAEFLAVTPEAVAAAIVSGEPLQGWFVDWQAEPENS